MISSPKTRHDNLSVGDLVCWLVVFYVPSTARSFRDGTPIYCPLRRTWSSVFYAVPTGNRTPGRRVAFHYTTAAPFDQYDEWEKGQYMTRINIQCLIHDTRHCHIDRIMTNSKQKCNGKDVKSNRL